MNGRHSNWDNILKNYITGEIEELEGKNTLENRYI